MNSHDDFLLRGEVWLADLEPVQKRELGRARLMLIVSATKFNNGPAELVLVLPITTRHHSIPCHVPIKAPEAGMNKDAFILCEQVQCLARERLMKRLGSVEHATMRAVDDRLCILLNLFEPA